MRSSARRGRTPVLAIATAFALAATMIACSRALKQTVATPGAPPPIASLWEEPRDLATRNLLHGPGGDALMPGDGRFEFVARDVTGHSPGFDVKDAKGVEWSVKLGPEAQSEVATSRILWAMGFHQPPTYYLATWTLTGAESGTQTAGRFRPELPDHKVIGDWSWYENPFVGTREFGGLIVANLLLTNWDWKTSNNKIYATGDGGAQPVSRPRSRRLAGQVQVPDAAEVVPAARVRPGQPQRRRGLRGAGVHQEHRRGRRRVRLPRHLQGRREQRHAGRRRVGVRTSLATDRRAVA